MNKKMLKSKMALNSDTNSTLAAVLGITPQRFSAKINETGGAEFTQGEIEAIKIRYELTPEEIDLIFFNV